MDYRLVQQPRTALPAPAVNSRTTPRYEILSQFTVLAFAVILAGGACSSSSSSSPPTTVDHPPAQFVEGPRAKAPEPVPLLANARCGELVVPVHRAKADGPTMRLAIAIIPSKNAATPPRNQSCSPTAGPGRTESHLPSRRRTGGVLHPGPSDGDLWPCDWCVRGASVDSGSFR
jgi:hypothetical protein